MAVHVVPQASAKIRGRTMSAMDRKSDAERSHDTDGATSSSSKTPKKTQRSNSSVFAMFSQNQIAEFKEVLHVRYTYSCDLSY